MLLVLFAASGGHWMALQSVAWSRMLFSYSRGGHFVAAVTKTFDGRHPCELCKQIQRAKSGEPQPERGIEVENQAAFVAPALVVLMRNDGISWNLEIPEWRGAVRAQQLNSDIESSIMLHLRAWRSRRGAVVVYEKACPLFAEAFCSSSSRTSS